MPNGEHLSGTEGQEGPVSMPEISVEDWDNTIQECANMTSEQTQQIYEKIARENPGFAEGVMKNIPREKGYSWVETANFVMWTYLVIERAVGRRKDLDEEIRGS